MLAKNNFKGGNMLTAEIMVKNNFKKSILIAEMLVKKTISRGKHSNG